MQEPYWNNINDETNEEIWENIFDAFLGPPPPDRPFQSIVARVYSRKSVTKIFDKTRTLPSRIEPDDELTSKKLQDQDGILVNIIQRSNLEQFVKIEGMLFRITSTEIDIITDGKEIVYEVRLIFSQQETDSSHIPNIESQK